MSKAHILKNLAKKEEQQDKKTEVAYVRAEKAADEVMSQKLVAAYGPAAARRDDGTRRYAWKCGECHFANYESRLACANCLAVPPRKDKDGKVITEKERVNIVKAPTNTDRTVHLMPVGQRFYRSHCDHRAAVARAATGGRRSGSTSPQPQQTTRPRSNEEDDDDGPSCGANVVGGGCVPADGDDDGLQTSSDARLGYDEDRRLFVMRLACPRRYHRFIIGKQAKTLKDIERSAKVKIIIPQSRRQQNSSGAEEYETLDENDEGSGEFDFVLVEGDTADAVRMAQLRIDTIMTEMKDKVDYTHFVSIPLGPIPSAKAAFNSAIEDMKHALINDDTNVDESIFQTPAKMHITLLMLRLYSKADIDRAKFILESIEMDLHNIFGPNDAVSLQGVRAMNPDPRNAHVVYVDVVKDDVHRRLQNLVNGVNRSFIDGGLATDKDVEDNGKLHVTVMNSKWRRGKPGHTAFNASEALRIFGGKDFGSHRLRSIEINTLGGGLAPDGYFSSVMSVRFP
jgi:2'-5' RNA ligase